MTTAPPRQTRFEACRDFTQVQEGGYNGDRVDPGNWWGHVMIGCYAGVTPASLARCYRQVPQPLTAAYMRHLPSPALDAVYLSFWAAMGCEGLGPGIDLMCFDFGFNAGERQAVLTLQECLRFPVPGDPATALDGFCGATTLRVARQAEPRGLIHDLHDAQALHYSGLPQFDRYGEGWLGRTARRRDAALAAITD